MTSNLTKYLVAGALGVGLTVATHFYNPNILNNAYFSFWNTMNQVEESFKRRPYNRSLEKRMYSNNGGGSSSDSSGGPGGWGRIIENPNGRPF